MLNATQRTILVTSAALPFNFLRRPIYSCEKCRKFKTGRNLPARMRATVATPGQSQPLQVVFKLSIGPTKMRPRRHCKVFFFFCRAADPLIIVCIRKRRNGPRRAPNGPVITGHNSTPTPPIRQEMARQIERNCTLSWFLEGGGLNGIGNIGQPLTGQTPAEQVTRRCRDV